MKPLKTFLVSLTVLVCAVLVWQFGFNRPVHTSSQLTAQIPEASYGLFNPGDCIGHKSAKSAEFIIVNREQDRYRLITYQRGKPVAMLAINPAYSLTAYMDKFYVKINCENKDISRVKTINKDPLYSMRILLMKQDLHH